MPMVVALIALSLCGPALAGPVDPIREALERADAREAAAEGAAQPLPVIVVPVPSAAGVPEETCEEALKAAAAFRKTRPEPTPPAGPVRPPQDPQRRPSDSSDDDGVAGRPRVTVSESGVRDSGLPGVEPDRVPLEPLQGNPEALRRVGDVLRKAAMGQRTRITTFGASHTGGDFWTGHLRRLLQGRYGDLGHGWILPAALYTGYRGQDLNLCRTDGWTPDWVGKKRGRDDGLYGFGASVSSYDPADLGWLETTTDNDQG
ncbi:MAG: hypothetical protein H6742_21545, partial [Alphaproteobacteria bacterium]|nr:hypothetical protein [Alphaproteobacteria bacterium]